MRGRGWTLLAAFGAAALVNIESCFATDIAIKGFANVEFGMTVAEVKKHIKIDNESVRGRDDKEYPGEPFLTYTDHASGYEIRGGVFFKNKVVTEITAYVDTRNISTLSGCVAVFDDVFGKLKAKYGAADTEPRENMEVLQGGGSPIYTANKSTRFTARNGAYISASARAHLNSMDHPPTFNCLVLVDYAARRTGKEF